VDRERNRAVVVVRRGGSELTRWGVPLDRRPDLEVLDELARVALAASRSDDVVTIHVFCPRLASLIDLAGLRDALGARGFGALLDGDAGADPEG
jgi:hypothetical protein